MARVDWDILGAVYQQVLAVAPAARGARLAELCPDPALRCEVESLLGCEVRTPDDFLIPPPVLRGPDAEPEQPDAGPDAPVGAQLGHYTIVRLIGAGGMGKVYAAVQDEPQRTVALKILDHRAASRSALRRFRMEAELLGRLRHPHVAQIYQAGMHTDREGRLGPPGGSVPFFAMEYVPEARSITAFATGNGLSVRSRLELFAKVCDAVHHGHQQGIIHRDLKPANILVDSAGEPKVIDFGVARATDQDLAQTTLATTAGLLIGTVQYMSPEQCAGDPTAIDTRSDVYSLGVVLYELLTGAFPYDATGVALVQATRSIEQVFPRRPSVINRRLRGDIETILLKALEKEREKRYGSAAELAQDIRRYLRGAPIEARAPTLWTRAVRWGMRHPVWTTAAACLLMLAGAIAGSYWVAWRFHQRPDHTLVDAARRRAMLVAPSLNELASWDSGVDGGMSFARFWPGNKATPPLVTIGFGEVATVEYRAGLAIFEAGSWHEPNWVGRLEPQDIPTVLQDRALFSPANFHVQCVLVEDIFPAVPGDEIVAVHKQADYTQSAIRIYALDGSVLWQVWADFQVDALCWLPQEQLLVVGGYEARVYWADRDVHDVRRPTQYPNVVFALRPQLNTRLAHYVCDAHPDERLRLAWVTCLLPANIAEHLGSFFLTRAPRTPGAGGVVDVTVCTQESSPVYQVGLRWRLDARGGCIGGPWPAGDYGGREALDPQDPRWVPPRASYCWRALPPIVSEPNDPTTRDLKANFGQ